MNYGSHVQRAVYYHAPGPLRNVLATIYGIGQKRLRYGQGFHRWLTFLKESQFWSDRDLHEYQQRQWEAFRDALRSTPHYAERDEFRKCHTIDDLRRLPLLTKSETRENQATLRNPKFSGRPVRWAHTSGTTGKSIVFPISLDCFQREYAFRSLHYSWSGVELPSETRVAICQGHPVTHPDSKQPPFWVEDKSNRTLVLSSYHLSPRNLPAYVRKIEAFRPSLLLGYPSSLYLLALSYRDSRPAQQFVRAVYTTSETLLPWQRNVIESAFQCKVFDWYGNSEMCGNIVECEYGQRHLKLEHSICEIVDEDGLPVPPGGSGSLVCTGFGNHAFPLVRYEVGDVVEISRRQYCQCRRGGVLIEKILGRVEDYVIAGDGRLVGRLDHLFKDSQNVVEAQVVQSNPGEVTLRIVRGPNFGRADIDAIEREAALRLGSGTTVHFQFVATIPRTANGKFRFVESSVAHSSLPNFQGRVAEPSA